MTKIVCANFEGSFLERQDKASRKIIRHFLHAIVLISTDAAVSELDENEGKQLSNR